MSNKHADQIEAIADQYAWHADRLRESAAEIARLHALVKAAYREGFREGMKGAAGDYPVADAWVESNTRAALDGAS